MLVSHLETTVELMPSYIITTVVLTVIISALTGINFAMMAFKIKRMKRMNSIKDDSSDVLVGVCRIYSKMSTPLVIILGSKRISLFLMQGLELKFISVRVLIFFIFWITRGLQSKSCCKI